MYDLCDMKIGFIVIIEPVLGSPGFVETANISLEMMSKASPLNSVVGKTGIFAEEILLHLKVILYSL